MRILIEDISEICRVDSQLQISSLCSVRILTRIRDITIFLKPFSALIPSLDGRFPDDELQQILDDMATKRSFQY